MFIVTTAWRDLGLQMENGLQQWKLAANILNEQPPDKRQGVFLQLESLAWANNPSSLKRNKLVTKSYEDPRIWTDYMDKRPKRWSMDMRFGTWNVNLFRAGSLMIVSRELSRYIRFELFVAVTMKNSAFCDVKPCGSCTNRRFKGK
jgi:hypothetical protein